MDLKGFAHRIDEIAFNVPKNANKMVRAVALSVDKYVVLATPVDTGRARSNWQVSLNNAIMTQREPYSHGKDGSTVGPNTSAALQQCADTVAQRKDGEDVYITNNLDYITKLNDGWSRQAPAGFVQASVIVGVRAARRIKIIE